MKSRSQQRDRNTCSTYHTSMELKSHLSCDEVEDFVDFYRHSSCKLRLILRSRVLRVVDYISWRFLWLIAPGSTRGFFQTRSNSHSVSRTNTAMLTQWTTVQSIKRDEVKGYLHVETEHEASVKTSFFMHCAGKELSHLCQASIYATLHCLASTFVLVPLSWS